MSNKSKFPAPEEVQTTISNVGKWTSRYKGLSKIETYSDETSYKLAADFLSDMETVEDWGCGSGGFRLFCKSDYVGIDGSESPYVDKVVELATYKTSVDGIMLRHVLEHNPAWENILKNALGSFRKKLCIILFTPFSEKTKVLEYYKWMDVVDISFNREDFIQHFDAFRWTSDENLQTDTQYGVEHVFYIERT